MFYIGTSLGRCIPSILRGEVDKRKVALIITRTRAPEYESFIHVLQMYYQEGNGYSAHGSYSFDGIEWDDVEDLAYELWHTGRIHQPRNFGGSSILPAEEIWIELAPTNTNTNPSVVAAYDNYKTLRNLAE